MCFGQQQQSTTTTTPTANPIVANAAQQNIAAANSTLGNANNNTFGTQYQGPLTAAIAPNQQSTINSAGSIADNGTAPAASSLISQYASAPASSVNSNSIASNMSPYMNAYVSEALAPQLQQQQLLNAQQNQQTDATATGSGAFGDARTGIQQANNQFNQGIEQQGLVGNAYNAAFNTAIGAGAQDSSNQLTAATTNANLNETALNRALGGANALEGLQTQQIGNQTSTNALAQQDTAQQQASLTAQYNNWLQAQQSQVAAEGGATNAVQAGAAAMPASTTAVTSAPNNSGYALLGAALGTAAKLAA